jgi:hypothetical protein
MRATGAKTVDAKLLHIPLGNKPRLVLDNGAGFILLQLEDLVPFRSMASISMAAYHAASCSASVKELSSLTHEVECLIVKLTCSLTRNWSITDHVVDDLVA